MRRLIAVVVLVTSLIIIGRGISVAYDFFIEMQQISDMSCYINEEIQDI